jgi:hypothetical protein
VVGCDRKTAAIVVCRVEAALTSGRVCHSHFTLKQFEEGSVATEGALADLDDECDRLFLPPEIREHLEEEEREEEHEHKEAKTAKRGYDRAAGG